MYHLNMGYALDCSRIVTGDVEVKECELGDYSARGFAQFGNNGGVGP